MFPTLLFVFAVAAQPAPQPDPTAWIFGASKGYCAATVPGKDAALVRDRLGYTYLALHDVKLAETVYRKVAFGNSEAMLQFITAGQASFAALDSSALAALASSRSVSFEWPEGSLAATSLPPIENALEGLARCQSDLVAQEQAAQAAAAQAEQARLAAEQKRATSAQRLQALGRVLQGLGAATAPAASPVQGPFGGNAVCFKSREWTSGFYRNCAYSCMGSETVQTVGSAELCPLTIQR